ALHVAEDAGGYRSVYCMNVFYRGAERMPYKAFHWQASDVHIFQKLSRMGGRAVLTLAQSTRNESVKVARLVSKANPRAQTPQSHTGLCRNCVIQCHPSPWANSPVAITHL